MPASSEALSLDSPTAARTGGRDWLSLALIEARNRSLRWLQDFEEQDALLAVASQGRSPPALALIGRVGWLQEWWVGRNVQRLRGEVSSFDSLRLPSLDGRTDHWFSLAAPRWWVDDAPGGAIDERPTADDVRSALEATLEQTLDLLAVCPEADDALLVFRRALASEDRLSETLAVLAQALGVKPGDAAVMGGPAAPRPPRDPLWFPPQTHVLGSTPVGWVPPNERWAHPQAVPEFDIDAQAVSWQRFVEFAEDGGYDREPLWHPEGWRWLQAVERRAPRDVEQLRGGALVRRFGQLQRAPAHQAVSHVSWYEADAWCRWAGRRLPTEVEWELAACTARSRGHVWADVWEWAAGTARAWPGGRFAAQPASPLRVLRGASSWTVPRAAHVRQRRFVAADRDELFCGFRSCSL